MTDMPSSFEQMLEQQARQFTAANAAENGNTSRTLIIADFEFLFDRSVYDGYRISEGDTACPNIRWPFHRIAAASWMTATFIAGEDVPAIEGPFVLALDDMEERDLLDRFFKAVAGVPEALVVTWGGEVRDLAVLRHRAGLYNLVLPHQLRSGWPNDPTRLDLCRATAVQAECVHLSEFAASSGIPAKPIPAKQIGVLAEAGEWPKVREQVCADVLTTSVIALRFLAARALIQCDRERSVMAIAEAAAGSVPRSKFIRDIFKPWARGKLAAAGLRGTVFRAPDYVG